MGGIDAKSCPLRPITHLGFSHRSECGKNEEQLALPKRKGETKKRAENKGNQSTVKSVIFVPRTENGTLAKMMREKELEQITGFRF